jgi:hypothetical protein
MLQILNFIANKVPPSAYSKQQQKNKIYKVIYSSRRKTAKSPARSLMHAGRLEKWLFTQELYV